MTTCNYQDCPEVLTCRAGPGRPRKFCPQHTQKALQLTRLLTAPQCCQDAQRNTGGKSRTCPQHKQWARFVIDARAARGTQRDVDDYNEMLQQFGGGFRFWTHD